MSMLLCRQEPVNRPYYIRELDLHVHSSQELSYIIVRHPLLVQEGFVEERLFTFIKEQLDMGFFSLKMERLSKSGESDADVLCLFLQEADYCLPAEITKFRQQAAAWKKLHIAQYRKLRADYLVELGQYRKAISIYQKILELPRDAYVTESFIGIIHSNIAVCYARMFQYERAAKEYEKSYFFTREEETLKRLYFLSEIATDIKMPEHSRELIATEQKPDWEDEFILGMEHASECDESKRLKELFDKDPIRRQQGAEEWISEWKRKYRSMQSPS